MAVVCAAKHQGLLMPVVCAEVMVSQWMPWVPAAHQHCLHQAYVVTTALWTAVACVTAATHARM